MIMLQHLNPHFAAASNGNQLDSKSPENTSSGGESPGTSHDRSPSPVDRPASVPSHRDSSEDGHSRPQTPRAQSEHLSDDSADEAPPVELRRKIQTPAMKKEMARSRPHVNDDEDDAEDSDRARPRSRGESPPLGEILTNRVSISQRLSDKYNGSIIRRVLKQSSTSEGEQRDPVVVLNQQRLLLRDRLKADSPRSAVAEEDTDSNVPLDLSLNAEEKLQREQTEMFLRQLKKDDGTESDDSGGPGEDRGRAYKKSLMKRYCEYTLNTRIMFLVIRGGNTWVGI